MRRTILGVTLVLFGALSAVALWQHGFWGILAPHFQSSGAGQVFADLAFALSLVMVWMVRDAKASGRTGLLWIVFTLVAGSFGRATRPVHHADDATRMAPTDTRGEPTARGPGAGASRLIAARVMDEKVGR